MNMFDYLVLKQASQPMKNNIDEFDTGIPEYWTEEETNQYIKDNAPKTEEIDDPYSDFDY